MEDAKSIWIDMDNTPHVLFFEPILPELFKMGYKVFLTARDVSQVKSLSKLKKIDAEFIGGNFGKSKSLKIFGTIQRGIKMTKWLRINRPSLGLSLGSRSQILACKFTKIPTLEVCDYEHAKSLPFLEPDYILAPSFIPPETLPYSKSRVLSLPGLKEHIYLPFMKKDPSFRKKLQCDADKILITIRPPATEAHYHDVKSEHMLAKVIEIALKTPNSVLVLLPRNSAQLDYLRQRHEEWFSNSNILVPSEALDGLNLLWNSDLVVSGGGTMNREAACLGIPVYSIFSGKLGAVDQNLESQGLLQILKTVQDVESKLKVRKNNKKNNFEVGRNQFQFFLNVIENLLNQKYEKKKLMDNFSDLSRNCAFD